MLTDLTLHVDPGEVVGLLGPNGAGKTTAFHLASGLLPLQRGRVQIGETALEGPIWRRARLGLTYLPQQPSLMSQLNVEENLRLGVRPQDRDRAHDIVDQIIAEFGLSEVRSQLAKTLSGGERRRVEIARAQAGQTRFLLADEPFAALDPIGIEFVAKNLRASAKKGIGVLLSDHNVMQALDLCDRIYILIEGRVLKSGRPEAVVQDDAVRRRYLGGESKGVGGTPHGVED